MTARSTTLAAAVLALLTSAALGNPVLTGTKRIVLSNDAGERHEIGSIAFRDAGAGKTAFKIDLGPQFGDHFLAMRPFRCLTGAQQRLCWFPVTNEEQVISAQDLVPLEYALMFMKTKPTALHVNPFNGVYYKLSWTEGGLRGRVFDLDMDPFISPPADPAQRRARPVGAADLQAADIGSHWLPELRIE